MGNFSQTGVSPDGVVVGVWFLSVTYLLMLWLWRKSAILAGRWLQPQVGQVHQKQVVLATINPPTTADAMPFPEAINTTMGASTFCATAPTLGRLLRMARRPPGSGTCSATTMKCTATPTTAGTGFSSAVSRIDPPQTMSLEKKCQNDHNPPSKQWGQTTGDFFDCQYKVHRMLADYGGGLNRNFYRSFCFF